MNHYPGILPHTRRQLVLAQRFLALLFLTLAVGGCTHSRTVSGEAIGIGYPQALALHGMPAFEQELLIDRDSGLHEYQGNLYRLLEAGETLTLREVWWDKGNETLIIWFQAKGEAAVAVDSLRYGDWVAF